MTDREREMTTNVYHCTDITLATGNFGDIWSKHRYPDKPWTLTIGKIKMRSKNLLVEHTSVHSEDPLEATERDSESRTQSLP